MKTFFYARPQHLYSRLRHRIGRLVRECDQQPDDPEAVMLESMKCGINEAIVREGLDLQPLALEIGRKPLA